MFHLTDVVRCGLFNLFVLDKVKLLFDNSVTGCLRFVRCIVQEVLLQGHQGVRLAAVVTLAALSQSHEAVARTACTVASSTEARYIAKA